MPYATSSWLSVKVIFSPLKFQYIRKIKKLKAPNIIPMNANSLGLKAEIIIPRERINKHTNRITAFINRITAFINFPAGLIFYFFPPPIKLFRELFRVLFEPFRYFKSIEKTRHCSLKLQFITRI